MARVVQHHPVDFGNIRSFDAVNNQLQVEYEDDTMAIASFTLDPNAAGLQDQSINVRNETGGDLAEGELVFVSGWNVATSEFLVAKASAPTNGANLAQFIMRTTLGTATSGQAFKSHTLTGQDTSGAVVGDPVFLSDTPGGFTLTPPSFAKQIVGRVAVVNAITGEIEFLLLPDSDTGFIRSNPAAGEFPVSAAQRDSSGLLKIEYDDVAV